MEKNNTENILQIKRLSEKAAVPSRQTGGSAGYDLSAHIESDVSIEPGSIVQIPTGIAVEMPAGFVGMVYGRSGMGAKHGVHLINGVGVIDSDYRGEISVNLMNSGTKTYVVKPSDRIAQIVFTKTETPEIKIAEKLSDTDRGESGFGSTGR